MTTMTIPPCIEKADGFKVGTKLLATLAEAQKEALSEFFRKLIPEINYDALLDVIIANAPAVVAILSPPKELRVRKRRKDYGVSHKKKTATPKPHDQAT